MVNVGSNPIAVGQEKNKWKNSNSKFSKNLKILVVFCLIFAISLYGYINKNLLTKADTVKA